MPEPPRIYYSALRKGTSPHPIVAATWLTMRGWPLLYVGPGDEAEPWFDTPITRIAADFSRGKEGQSLGVMGHLSLMFKILKHRFKAHRQSLFYIQGSALCPAAWIALMGFDRRRIVYETLDFLEPGRHRLWEFFERRFARRAGWCICNEPSRARFFQSHYRLGAAAISVHTALPKDWSYPDRNPALRATVLAKANRTDDGQQRLIMVGGSYSKLRMTQQVVDAARLLPPNYLLVFTGTKPGSESEMKTRQVAQDAGVLDRSIFVGFLDFDELLAHFAVCDIGVLLYPDDGVGNFYQSPGRLAEYIGVGLPFVTSNFPGLELLTLKYDIGVACNPYEPAEIAAAFRTIGDRPETELAILRSRLRDLARGELSYDAQAGRMEAIVKKVLGMEKPPAGSSSSLDDRVSGKAPV